MWEAGISSVILDYFELAERIGFPLAVLVSAIGVAWTFFRGYYGDVLSAPADQVDRFRQSLEAKRSPSDAYRSALTTQLNGFSRLIGDASLRNAWTGQSYGVCLTLCIAIPPMALALNWLATGSVGVLGEWFGFASDTPLRLRLLVVLHVVLCIIALDFMRQAGVFRSTSDGSSSFDEHKYNFGMLAVMGAAGVGSLAHPILAVAPFLVLGVTMAYGAYGVSGLGYVGPFVSGFVTSIIAVLSIDPAPALATPREIARALAPETLLFAANIGVFVLTTVRAVNSKVGDRGLFFAAFFVLSLAIFFLDFRLLPANASEWVFTPSLILLVLIPMIVSACVWVALGASRWLMSKATDARGAATAAYGLLDLTFGIAMTALLSNALIAALLAFNTNITHAPPAFLAPIWDGVAELQAEPNATKHYWIYFIALTPLIPSVIHICAVGAGLFFLVTGPFRRSAARLIARGRDGQPEAMARAKLLLSATASAGVGFGVVFLGLASLVVWGLLPNLGDTAAEWARLSETW